MATNLLVEDRELLDKVLMVVLVQANLADMRLPAVVAQELKELQVRMLQRHLEQVMAVME